ncbi:MAG: hypothetical protein FWF01_00230 [Alphaproteobacteria bacterium]|nr:hypothetical protein [Alphaproteobacteria bacterium]
MGDQYYNKTTDNEKNSKKPNYGNYGVTGYKRKGWTPKSLIAFGLAATFVLGCGAFLFPRKAGDKEKPVDLDQTPALGYETVPESGPGLPPETQQEAYAAHEDFELFGTDFYNPFPDPDYPDHMLEKLLHINQMDACEIHGVDWQGHHFAAMITEAEKSMPGIGEMSHEIRQAIDLANLMAAQQGEDTAIHWKGSVDRPGWCYIPSGVLNEAFRDYNAAIIGAENDTGIFRMIIPLRENMAETLSFVELDEKALERANPFFFDALGNRQDHQSGACSVKPGNGASGQTNLPKGFDYRR